METECLKRIRTLFLALIITPKNRVFFLSNVSGKKVRYVCRIIIVVRKIKIFQEIPILHHKYSIKPTPLKQSFGILIRIDKSLLRELISGFQSAVSYNTAVVVIIMY